MRWRVFIHIARVYSVMRLLIKSIYLFTSKNWGEYETRYKQSLSGILWWNPGNDDSLEWSNYKRCDCEWRRPPWRHVQQQQQGATFRGIDRASCRAARQWGVLIATPGDEIGSVNQAAAATPVDAPTHLHTPQYGIFSDVFRDKFVNIWSQDGGGTCRYWICTLCARLLQWSVNKLHTRVHLFIETPSSHTHLTFCRRELGKENTLEYSWKGISSLLSYCSTRHSL